MGFALLAGCASPAGPAIQPGRVDAGSCPVASLGVVAAVGEGGGVASDVFLVGLDLALTPLTDTGRAVDPVLDRSATRIAYLVNDGSVEADSATSPYALWVGELEGDSMASRPIAQSADFTSVAMAPDGDAVAVVGSTPVVGPDEPRPTLPLNPDGTLPDQQDSLYLLDPVSGRATQLVRGTPEAFVDEVAWTPDGSMLVYITVQSVDGRLASHVWRRSASDAAADPTLLYIYPDDSGVTVLDPSADGSAVVARGLAAEGPTTTRIDLDTGQATSLYGADELFRFSAISGETLLGATDDPESVQVQAVTADGSTLRLGTWPVSLVTSTDFLPCLQVGIK